MAQNKKWYEIKNQVSGEMAEILIYEPIGSGCFTEGVEAKKFYNDLKNIEADTVKIRINSPGGSVFEGLAIYNILLGSSKKIITQVDGIAASIASIIYLAGQERIMAENSYLLMHNPTAIAFGDHKEMETVLGFLNKLADTMVDIYEKGSNLTASEVRKLMDKETMLNSKEASKIKMVDIITGTNKAAASADTLLAGFHSLHYSVENKNSSVITNKSEEVMEKNQILKALDCTEEEALNKVNALINLSIEQTATIESLKKEIEEKDSKLAEFDNELKNYEIDQICNENNLNAEQKESFIKLYHQDKTEAIKLVKGFKATAKTPPGDELKVTDNSTDVSGNLDELYNITTEKGVEELRNLYETNPVEFDKVMKSLNTKK